MTLEFRGSLDPAWLRADPEAVPALIRALPSFVAEDEPCRFVLKAADSPNDWEADVWIWLRDDALELALVSPTSAWLDDVRGLVEELGVALLDDDGDPAEFD